MRSLKSTAAAPDGGQKPAEGKPSLVLVKGGQRRTLTTLEREFLPPLLAIQESPPSPVKRALLWAIVALMVTLTAWAYFGHLSIVSTAPGKFIPDGRVKQIQPLESSIVKAIHVREGQHVERGDVLLELDPTLSEAEFRANADKYGFNRLEQARLRGELTQSMPAYRASGQSRERIALEERLRLAREQAHAAKLAGAQAEVEDRKSALAAAEATLQKYQETGEITEEREASARPLVATGAISRDEYLKLKEDLSSQHNDRVAQERTVEQDRALVTVAEQKVSEVERDRVADVYNELDQKVANEPALKGDLDKSRQLLDLKWLRAPVSGWVQRLEVTTVGQVVTPAESLVTVVPDGTPLIVEASLSNQDIGYVRVGQPVEIKVDTFPFQKYGTLKGILEWVSPDADEKSSASSDVDTRTGAPARSSAKTANDGNAGFVYKVHIRPDRDHFVVQGRPTALQAGMTVQADITTDRRRVIEFFLSPITKYLDEGLKVR